MLKPERDWSVELWNPFVKIWERVWLSNTEEEARKKETALRRLGYKIRVLRGKAQEAKA